MNQESITRYWHAVELLQPQSAPKIEKRDSLPSSFFHDINAGRPVMPWTEQSPIARQPIAGNRIWSHTLFAHLYDSKLVAEKLKALYGADQGYREQPKSRESALFALKFTAQGMMVQDSLVLSSEAWFLGKALTGKDWKRGFDEDQNALREDIKPLMGGQVDAAALLELTARIRRFLGVDEFFQELALFRHRFRSTPVKEKKPEPEDDPLNSFLLSDLADVSDSLSKGTTSKALDQYLKRHSPENRLHVDEDDASAQLIERLTPKYFAPGCWPAERHLGLVHSQQLAVNTIIDTLAEGEGLIGVNGPPGTGKTTLLRDLIAAVVTRRADVLASLSRASQAFVEGMPEKVGDGADFQNIHKLDPAFFGFEIVIASSNNGAVENVTMELPQRNKIDESWLPEADYFGELGELVSGQPAWGLISAALGSKARRKAFVSRYFYGQAPEKTKAGNKVDEATEWLPALDAEELDDEPEAADSESGESPDEDISTPRGFLGWLKTHADTTRTTAQRQDNWRQAVAAYNAAKARVEQMSADANGINAQLLALNALSQQVTERSDALRQSSQNIKDVEAQLTQLDEVEFKPARHLLQECLLELQRLQQNKPGFLANLFSFWGAHRNWSTQRRLISARHLIAEEDFERIKRSTLRLTAERTRLDDLSRAEHQALTLLQERQRQHVEHVTRLAQTCKAEHLLAWLRHGIIGRGEAIELVEPWAIKGWRETRAQVFIQALKLHQCFFELEAKRIRANLFFINSVLQGGRFQGVSRDAIRSSWASLFMLVPVLSSTFASFARSFGSLGVGEIGWLLVDEAGQATPQAAVGALWRARRAVLVGDPLQLKPIITVSDAVLEHMRTRYAVDPHWLPNRQSAQTLADEATLWGRMMGPAQDKRWVGLPLVVHRRCDRPMYALANRIAYDGVMVFGTLSPSPEKETTAGLPTGWIQASGASTGNWVAAEGTALQSLLGRLRDEGVSIADISVITPFQAVRERIKQLLPRKMVFGTIHTMQGKEAAVVIMVLGGSSENPGARDWVVSEPNLLNVAATRAKRRFYVIGDRNDWRHRSLFCDVMDLLPLQQLELPVSS
ncbi:DNA helicase related protein [Pseudomonas yamanorum]|uniref:DEAD/DEAH box helicase n=1 Tax=Pseudomonas TaxID=286 RepID=UPI0007A3B3EA|nr:MULTISPECIES: ATP-binding protein [Pseudomonas]AMW83054.1 DNA helicase related protein [Pseudomonas yamanorum]NVZ89388.1 ATP-binding protein [Pseudomonas yamanorum]